MNINDLEWVNRNAYWDTSYVPGRPEYVFWRYKDTNFGREAGTYDVTDSKAEHHYYEAIDPIAAQAILYHLLAGGNLDEHKWFGVESE